MKRILSAVAMWLVVALTAVGLSAGMVACTVSEPEVRREAPDLIQEYTSAQDAEQKAAAQVAVAEQEAQAAAQSSDPSDDLPAAERLAAANRDLQAAEDKLAAIEAEILKRRASPFAALLPGSIGGAVMALVPLAGKRGRKLYGSAFRNLSKGQLLTAVGDVLKAMGAQHSSPQPPPAPESAPQSPSA